MCHSAVGFDRRLGKKTLHFGISGYIYRSAALYYDRETESFWAQMTGQAVAGPLTGRKLKVVPTEVTTWADWRNRHPKTTVLLPPRPLETYRKNPYEEYFAVDRRHAPIGNAEKHPRFREFRRKSVVTIVFLKDEVRCYPHKLWQGRIEDRGLVLVRKGPSVRVTRKGEAVPAMQAFWFAWCAFYPNGKIYAPPKKSRKAGTGTQPADD